MMPRSHSKREGSTKRVTMVSVETQTEVNDFCLCFVPTYTCKNEEQEVMLDPRITADLNQVDWESEDGKLFVRNFEVNPKPKQNAKQRWRISGKSGREDQANKKDYVLSKSFSRNVVFTTNKKIK